MKEKQQETLVAKLEGLGFWWEKQVSVQQTWSVRGSERYFMHYDSDGDGSDAAGDDSGDAGAVMVMLVMRVTLMVVKVVMIQ